MNTRKERINNEVTVARQFLEENGQPVTDNAYIGYLASEVVRLRDHIKLCEDIIDENDKSAATSTSALLRGD